MSTLHGTDASVDDAFENASRLTLFAVAAAGAAVVIGAVLIDRLLHHASNLPVG
ncbi:MAG: hypothetical protein IPO93_07545 [Actinobacteria bacterium]|jgi:hypothetical protein|nr:hypothetical protein [Actinomycetota bacterium]